MNFSKVSSKYLIVTISLAGVLFSSALGFYNHQNRPMAVLVIAQPAFASPTRLKIPSLNIDASVEEVGVTPNGEMDVPKEPEDVAWFKAGPDPGETGSSVIDGHSGYKNNVPAIFDNLSKLQKGDKVYVEDENGVNVVFLVRELKNYNADETVPEVFASSDGLAHLNLITCDGVWNPATGTHSERLVVFTDKE